MTTIESFLKEHDACSGGATFARKYSSLAEAWDACERPDWLLWAYKRAVKPPDDKQLRLFACWCVRQVWDKLTDVRSRRAVEVAEAYANGLATKEELRTARKEAYAAAAYAAAAAAYAAAAYDAAYATAYATADATYDAAYAATYDATCAAAYFAAYDAAYFAASATRKAQAAQLRTMIPNPFL